VIGVKAGRARRHVYDHSELWRTRRCVPERGFLTTIQNMMDVAKLSAYLQALARTLAKAMRGFGGGGSIPSKDILRMVIPQVHRRRPADRHALGLALVIREQIRRCYTVSPHTCLPLTILKGANSLIVSSTHTR
jgi:hypothetical protein